VNPTLLLAALIVVTLVLRFYRLGEWNLQATEIFTLRFGQAPVAQREAPWIPAHWQNARSQPGSPHGLSFYLPVHLSFAGQGSRSDLHLLSGPYAAAPVQWSRVFSRSAGGDGMVGTAILDHFSDNRTLRRGGWSADAGFSIYGRPAVGLSGCCALAGVTSKLRTSCSPTSLRGNG
jgi:hypothetical protein